MRRDGSAQLGDATWTQIRDQKPIIVVPIGSCEQHGPQLPLDTDTRIASAVADRLVAARVGLRVTPVLAITASGEHQGFPGTLSIGAVVMRQVIVELVRSADWASGVVLINGHGGNSVAVREAVSQLHGEGRRVLNWWPRINNGDAHAGRTETSLMLALHPDLVRLSLAEAGRTEPLPQLIGQLRTDGVIGLSPNGVLGDPSGANAAEGEELLAALVNDVCTRFDSWLQ